MDSILRNLGHSLLKTVWLIFAFIVYVCVCFGAVGAAYYVFIAAFLPVVVVCTVGAFCLVLAEAHGVSETDI